MANASAVTSYLHKRNGDPNSALHFIPTLQGLYYRRDAEGEFWRMTDFLGGFCLDTPETDADFYQSALAFGQFQELLADFPAESLYETIPESHNTIDRYRQLHESIDADNMGRKKLVQPEIDFALSLEELGGTLQRMRKSGKLPLRVTHNDPKLNDVILDKEVKMLPMGALIMTLEVGIRFLKDYLDGDVSALAGAMGTNTGSIMGMA